MTTVQCRITLNNEFINSIIYKSNWWERGWEGVVGTSTRRALLVVDVLLVFDCVEAGM